MSKDTSVETVAQCCPSCGHRFDRASEMHFKKQHTPKPGDVSVCINCAQISIFVDSAGRLRKAEPADIREMMKDSAIWREVQRAVMAVNAIPSKSQASGDRSLP